eukprot:TRINITY_DN1438_c0_g2_i1.p1 TRINITY_DN1438_c0_g2~~TRINITY_DN1438_c0_g2_i1.p1  ORF type:complete len:320 (-),score=33.17 TRINITY_DN1438_c0_g2_i1:32-991(-)
MEIQTITVAVIVILVMFLILRPRRKRIANFYGEAVLISGASSGLGREIALNLSERGFVVFAGYRKNEDREALLAANEARKPQGKLIPVQLDVTKEEDISAVFKTVSEYVGSKGLLGLINNAGVFHDPAQPSEHIPLEEWRRVFEVNLFGVVRMSQVFLPLLLANQHKGRLCNMSSPAGAVHLPFFGPYCATKAALESTTNVFRLELLKNNVHVVTFSPAALESPMVKQLMGATDETSIEHIKQKYPKYAGMAGVFQKFAKATHGKPGDPQLASKAAFDALTLSPPHARYEYGDQPPLIAKIMPAHWRDFIMAKVFKLET